MEQKVSWYIPDRVLHVVLDGQPTFEDLQSVNQQIVGFLDKSKPDIYILFDVMNMGVGYRTTDDLRNTQKYLNHARLYAILVVTDNKLNRLITLMAFGLGRNHFFQFDAVEKVNAFLKHRGLEAGKQA